MIENELPTQIWGIECTDVWWDAQVCNWMYFLWSLMEDQISKQQWREIADKVAKNGKEFFW